MRYVLLVCLLGLALAFDLGVFIASSDDAAGTFDPLQPATLLPIMAERLHTLRSQVGELDVRHFLDIFVTPYREGLKHEGAIPVPGP